mmetsp:Transcript_2464/g.8866  ORF Transcript_2464/g.8866 Transcript_2464/m.8866 type:complete len:248 (+) Transcript_2464:2484-3227(+)
MKGSCSLSCRTTNLRLHFCVILRNVSTAMSCTPGCVSCMNSKSLFTTVLRNFQCARRKRGYWPTTYMMLLAITALCSLPRMISHRFSRSRITVTRKRFSWSSAMDPEMEPMAQQSVLRLFHDHSLPLSCMASFSSICFSVSSWSRLDRKMRVSRIILYCTSTSLSLRVSRTKLPFSSSTMSTSSGLAMWEIISTRSLDMGAAYSCLREGLPPAPAPGPACAAPLKAKGEALVGEACVSMAHCDWKRS